MVSWYRGYHDCAEGNAYTGKVTSARVSSCRNISKTGEQHICNVTWWPGNWDWEWDLPPLPLAASTSQSTRPGSCRHPGHDWGFRQYCWRSPVVVPKSTHLVCPPGPCLYLSADLSFFLSEQIWWYLLVHLTSFRIQSFAQVCQAQVIHLQSTKMYLARMDASMHIFPKSGKELWTFCPRTVLTENTSCCNGFTAVTPSLWRRLYQIIFWGGGGMGAIFNNMIIYKRG